PADAIEMLRSGKADVFGADSGLIGSIAGGYPGAKIVPGAFNTVRVAVALPKGRSSAAQAKLDEIVKEAKQTGVVQKEIKQAGPRSGVPVAPECPFWGQTGKAQKSKCFPVCPRKRTYLPILELLLPLALGERRHRCLARRRVAVRRRAVQAFI